MKKLILFMVGIALALPSGALAIQKFQRTGEIKVTDDKSYAPSQRDTPAARRAKQIKDKTGSGYRDGHYCGTGEKYKKGEWQFVDQSGCGGGKSAPKNYKKVKETDSKPQKKATKQATEKKATKQAAEKKETKAPETKPTTKVVDEE